MYCCIYPLYAMELWVPYTVTKDEVRVQIQRWLDDTSKHAYQNIIQDRVNSLYPRFGESKILYIMTVSQERIVNIESKQDDVPQTFTEVKLCPICHEEDNVVRHTLRCNHTFHLHCINEWFRRQNTCPLCRCRIY